MSDLRVHFGIGSLHSFLDKVAYDKIFILCDSNTEENCLQSIDQSLVSSSHLIVVSPGDDRKNLHTCESIWTELMAQQATRHSVLINLGGGMVTDIGGFAAATFKRGIDFVNVPTTLLGAVDAAIGGKTGINFQQLKNQIGTFNNAKAVFVDPVFFKTLSPRELRSGLAEVIKYGLIWDEDLFHTMKGDLESFDLTKLVDRSIAIKQYITTEDPFEKGVRQLLNFGHTVGHALEAFSYSTSSPLKHGEAVALGMMAESFISQERLGFQDLDEVQASISALFEFPNWLSEMSDFTSITELMAHDKKNVGQEIRCSLLRKIGEGAVGFTLTQKEIVESLEWLRDAYQVGKTA